MAKGSFYEILVKLYLRLNGYFQSGLISHSAEWGNNATEIDIMAIRFPSHNQTEREIHFCPILSPSSTSIDIVIAEVKASSVTFNNPLKYGHPLADKIWNQVLNWIGLFEQEEITNLLPTLKAKADTNTSDLNGIEANSIFGVVKIKPIIFSIESVISNSNPKAYINGEEVIDYIWLCLCPDAKRENCSTIYPMSNWGLDFEPIVEYFKSRNESGDGKPTIKDIKINFNLT
jgi:hypothetical protein